MALFSRESQPPSYSDSRRYRPYLRVDFRKCCAYCERPEDYLGGDEIFEVDHFHPKSKFPELENVYNNLYYSCRRCNAHKWETWPSEQEIEQGLRFADPCVADPYVHDLKEEMDGDVRGITPSGLYTAAHIRLGREDVKRWRRLRVQARKDVLVFTAMMATLEQLRSTGLDSCRDELEEEIEAIKRYIADAKSRFGVG